MPIEFLRHPKHQGGLPTTLTPEFKSRSADFDSQKLKMKIKPARHENLGTQDSLFYLENNRQVACIIRIYTR